ncbi:Alcohol dehydrogenase zinc-binding domain protein [Pseudodesulfovibrio mercurii]|uniref:Alcohol dehydrogenase zinc-binding domain protein n=1 Tax=Pseudodesulfovibrio mercurii TaxID=641491 RepID=F0JD00_9BACT|nr:zinc-dependent alcohol dehydrogenase family protein [Pseudodesulfovibrio mercurii]EGB14492.1 Alcohol dehydrogenase zinc-binding domain protein [Pseudodesulfovibrio mercurii]
MKAMLIEEYGREYAFAESDIAVPEPGPGQVLVRVAGSSLNPIDNKIATMGSALAFSPDLPAVLGMDVSGTVEGVGPGVTRLALGDRVFGCPGGVRGLPGALAEFMVGDERLLARAPRCMDLTDAGAMPLVAVTAWLALFDKAGLKTGERLLVQGGAGGVGHLAVQLGVHAGAEVFATVSSPDKASVVEALGGTPIDYTTASVDDYVDEHTAGRGFDAVFDTVGGPVLDASFKAARMGGRVVSTNTRSSHDLGPLHAKSLSLHVVFMLLPLITGRGRERIGEILDQVAALTDADELAVLLDERRFDFRDIASAHRYWESGRALGKIGVSVSA